MNLDTDDPAAGADDGDLAKLVAPPDSGDDNTNGVLDPGETWTWVVTTNPPADVTVTATGHGTDPTGVDITYPGDPDAPPPPPPLSPPPRPPPPPTSPPPTSSPLPPPSPSPPPKTIKTSTDCHRRTTSDKKSQLNS